MYLEPLEKESVVSMHFENICVNVCGVKGESDMHECAHDVRVFGQSSYAFTQPVTPPLPPAHCLDNVKSTVNVLCSSGHQICVLAPLAILVMSQLILVPHGLSVLLSHLQSHFT